MKNENAENKRIKRHLILIAWIVLAGFVLAAGLTFYVDPFFHYHRPLSGFPYVIDNQLTQNPGMAAHFNYDSVILGSSMTVNFETDDFKEVLGLNTLKLSYSSAYPRDIANISEKVFAPYDDGREKKVKAVFLGLDIITYSGGVTETKYPLPEYLYDTNVINDVRYLLNKDVLLDYILRPIAAPEPMNLSHIYASWWTDDYYNEEWVLRNHTRAIPQAEEMERSAFVPAIRENLSVNIIPYITAHQDTEFVIFFPPYSILFWNDVMTENHLEATIEAYRCAAEELNAYPNVRLFFFPADEETVTNLNNYADYSHYHPDINRYMLSCFADGTDEIAKPGAAGAQLDDYIERLRAMLMRYDFDTLNRKLKAYQP